MRIWANQKLRESTIEEFADKNYANQPTRMAIRNTNLTNQDTFSAVLNSSDREKQELERLSEEFVNQKLGGKSFIRNENDFYEKTGASYVLVANYLNEVLMPFLTSHKGNRQLNEEQKLVLLMSKMNYAFSKIQNTFKNNGYFGLAVIAKMADFPDEALTKLFDRKFDEIESTKYLAEHGYFADQDIMQEAYYGESFQDIRKEGVLFRSINRITRGFSSTLTSGLNSLYNFEDTTFLENKQYFEFDGVNASGITFRGTIFINPSKIAAEPDKLTEDGIKINELSHFVNRRILNYKLFELSDVDDLLDTNQPGDPKNLFKDSAELSGIFTNNLTWDQFMSDAATLTVMRTGKERINWLRWLLSLYPEPDDQFATYKVVYDELRSFANNQQMANTNLKSGSSENIGEKLISFLRSDKYTSDQLEETFNSHFKSDAALEEFVSLVGDKIIGLAKESLSYLDQKGFLNN
ncbi:MAG: hypothetical protein SFU25_01650 [Candidatus Caenarcaniphilales bacterium]|nr:hypothetical protein [Candidatus Caenarcaniphilales bacterium]